MAFCSKSKTAKKRSWCKKTPCEVDNDSSCSYEASTKRCRAKISMKKVLKQKSMTPKAPVVQLRRSARLASLGKGVSIKKTRSRAKVLNGNASSTPGGLKKGDLIRTTSGIRSLKKHNLGKKNKWALAMKKARDELKLKGFVAVKKPSSGKSESNYTDGEKLYTLAKKYSN